MPSSPQRTKVFISYSREDEKYLKELQRHLKAHQQHLSPEEQNRRIDYWADTKLKSGDDWYLEIRKAIQSAKVAVLLVSIDFLASDFIATDELPPLLSAAKEEGLRIIPVLVGPCPYATSPLRKFQVVNRSMISLREINNKAQRDKIWMQVVNEILDALNTPSPPTIPPSPAALPSLPVPIPSSEPVAPKTSGKHLLIATLGVRPGVVSSMYDLLTAQKGLPLDQVIVLWPKDHATVRQAYELVREALPDRRLLRSEPLSFPDAHSWLNACTFLRHLYRLLEDTQDRGDTVYLSLAGGRKSMAAIMAWVVPFFSCVQGLYHVIADDETLFLSADRLHLMDPTKRQPFLHPDLKRLTLVDIPFEQGRHLDENYLNSLLNATESELDLMQYDKLDETILVQGVVGGKQVLDVNLTNAAFKQFCDLRDRDRRLAFDIQHSLLEMRLASRLRNATPNEKADHRPSKKKLRCFSPDHRPYRIVYYTEPADLFADNDSEKAERVVVCALEVDTPKPGRTLKKLAADPNLPTLASVPLDDLPAVSYDPIPTVLIVPLGRAPMVATQLYTLLQYRENHAIRAVFLVFPGGATDIKNAAEMVRDALDDETESSVRCCLIAIPQLSDIASAADCTLYQKTLEEVIDKAKTRDPDCRIDLALSGGRKGMTAMTIFAAQKKGLRRAYHTLITDDQLDEKIDNLTSVNTLDRLPNSTRLNRLFLRVPEYHKNGEELYQPFILFRVPIFSDQQK